MRRTGLFFFALCACLMAGMQVRAIEMLPTFGDIDHIHLPALIVQHADGDQSLQLRVQSTEHRTQTDYDEEVMMLKDTLQPFFVTLHVRQWKNVPITETWYEISHAEKKPVRLQRFDSGYLPLENGELYLVHLHGNWAGEAVPTVERLTRGVKSIRNSDGARNAHLDAPEVMISLDGVPQENSGRVLGAALCWSGNFEIRVAATDEKGFHFYAGIDPMASEYILSPKQVFTTPHLAYTYSNEGMGGVSRAFHRWARTCGMLHNGNATRSILLNSWEGIYFDITEERILAMMNDIAAFGGELFVMDDGWFGGKYQRNSDDAALGDWVVDTRKLPNGLEALTQAAKDRHIQFGIWIEPEAVNTRSELFEKHPEWALQERGRELKLGRGGTQLVLDMTNPKVQDFVFDLVDNLLTKHAEIAYIKWDANASIQNCGSTYLPRDKQSNLYIDYHLGLVKTLERIRVKYPKVVIQNCASGGGRANYGLMPYFDEFWVSDNNDALQRVYIQWGTSYFFPSNAMAQHIGGSPYLMTGRTTPIKFRCDVAMSGRLGMELQPAHMTDTERAQCTTAFKDYKELRHLIQLGNLYRLVSPYEPVPVVEQQQVASLMYVNDEKNHAVLFAYGLSSFMKQASRRIRLAGLDPDRTYTLKERNVRVGEQPCALDGQSFTGAYLMSVGLDVPLSTEYAIDYPSRIFEICSRQETRVLFGHQDDVVYGSDWQRLADSAYADTRSCIHDVTGQWPDLIGFDLGGIELCHARNLDSVPFPRMVEECRRQFERGGKVTLSWHARNPLTGGNSWDTTPCLAQIIDPDTDVHDTMQVWIERAAAFVAQIAALQKQPDQLIVRLWHEQSGNWFWWGREAGSAQDYIALWHWTRNYMNIIGVKALYAYSPDKLTLYGDTPEGAYRETKEWYPGDEYVDIIGTDCYHFGGAEGTEDYLSRAHRQLGAAAELAKEHHKRLAFTETGCESIRCPHWYNKVLLPLLREYPTIEYVLVWRNAWDIPQHFFLPQPNTAEAEDFKSFIQQISNLKCQISNLK